MLQVLNFPPQFILWIKGCITRSRFSVSINGSLAGYFKGGCGIRQGDPLSSYLFVIVMNILSRLLNMAGQHGVFQWHPKCKRVALTHLCFADDLLIFIHGDKDSVMGVKRVLDIFYFMSGLRLNAGKSELFAAGVKSEVIDQILADTGFKLGNLPVRYLGVPLVTSKLLVKDCEPLIRKIREKIGG